MAALTEYRPTHVRLPTGYAKEFSDYPDQRRFQQQHADYDADSLFYDVFFDIRRTHIWAVGPPLYSLAGDFGELEVFADGKRLAFTLSQYAPELDSQPGPFCVLKIKIPAAASAAGVTELEFVLGDVSWRCRVSEFPVTRQPRQPTMSVIQKDYAPAHVTEWLLWHYRLYGFRRFLLYDNGSANVAELVRALRELSAPIEVVLIHWRYYWGHRTPPYMDAFAQYTQVNHTRLLHSGIRCLITNWDMDEYLVCPSRAYWRLQKYRSHRLIPVGDALGTPGGRLTDCNRVAMDVAGTAQVTGRWKYFYTSDTAGTLRNVHWLPPSVALRRAQKIWRGALRFGVRAIDRLLRRAGIAPQLYILHAIYLRQSWNEQQTSYLAERTKAMERGEAELAAFRQCYQKAGFSE